MTLGTINYLNGSLFIFGWPSVAEQFLPDLMVSELRIPLVSLLSLTLSYIYMKPQVTLFRLFKKAGIHPKDLYFGGAPESTLEVKRLLERKYFSLD